MAASPADAAAQHVRRPSLETTLGYSVGAGGTFANRDGIALDVLLGIPLQVRSGSTIIGGLAAGMHGPIVGDVDCLLGPQGECVPDFPLLFSGGVLVGVQRGSPVGPSARLLAGPAYFGAQNAAALGLQGRIDVATPPFLHTAVTASLRGAMLPSFQGDAVGYAAFGLGLRVQ